MWAPLIYQYSLGGALFLFSLTLILKYRACDLRRAADRYWLAVVLIGLSAYFGLHLALYLIALFVPPHVAGGPG